MCAFFIGYHPRPTIGGPQDPDGCQPESDHARGYSVGLGARWCRWLLPRSYSLGMYDVRHLANAYTPHPFILRLGSKHQPRAAFCSSPPLRLRVPVLASAFTPSLLVLQEAVVVELHRLTQLWVGVLTLTYVSTRARFRP